MSTKKVIANIALIALLVIQFGLLIDAFYKYQNESKTGSILSNKDNFYKYVGNAIRGVPNENIQPLGEKELLTLTLVSLPITVVLIFLANIYLR